MAGNGGRTARRRKADCCTYKSKRIVLPLLAILSELKPDQRTFMLAHLDEKTLRTLCAAVDRVLHAKLPRLIGVNLKRRLLSNKTCLRRLCRHDGLTLNSVRNNLMKMGSGALKLVMKSAIPLY